MKTKTHRYQHLELVFCKLFVNKQYEDFKRILIFLNILLSHLRSKGMELDDNGLNESFNHAPK